MTKQIWLLFGYIYQIQIKKLGNDSDPDYLANTSAGTERLSEATVDE